MNNETHPGPRRSATATGRFAPWLLGMVGVAAVGGGVVAQSPPAVAGAVAEETLVQPLEALSTACIFAVQSLRAGGDRPSPARPAQEPEPRRTTPTSEGTASARPWGCIHDARFQRDGRLGALLVGPPSADPRRGSVLRVLPASAVRWDEARSQWVLVEPNLQLAELEAVANGQTEEPVKRTSSAVEWLLASQIVHAALAADAPGAAPAPAEGDRARLDARRVPITWFSPAMQRLVVVVVPVAARSAKEELSVKCVPLPWSLVRVTVAGDELRMSLPITVETLASAPATADAAERPTAALRRRSYEHFGMPLPEWDRSAAPPEPRK